MSEFLGTIVIVIVLWFGGTLILNHSGSLTAEDFIAYIALFYSIINPAKNFTNAFYSIQKGLAAMDRIDDVLKAESSIKETEKPRIIHDFKDRIEYKNVDFSYNESKQVLKKDNPDREKVPSSIFSPVFMTFREEASPLTESTSGICRSTIYGNSWAT